LMLARVGERDWRFVWLVHHIILDRWSMSQLLGEWRIAYDSIRNGHSANLLPTRPFGDYIGWIGEQDPLRAETYWRESMAGVLAPTTLPIDRNPGGMPGPIPPQTHSIHISAQATTKLHLLARHHRLTVNTIVQ